MFMLLFGLRAASLEPANLKVGAVLYKKLMPRTIKTLFFN